MATKLFLRESADNAINGFRDMLTTAGSVTSDGVVNTVESGTEIQWTDTAGGAVLEWISGRAPVGGFTLSGTMTFSIWARENNMSANCGARARVFKRTAAGTVTEVGGGPYNDGVEFGTAFAEMVWTGTPTSTAFAENDRLIVRYYITNIGTMGGGFTCTINYDAADAATGDSYFQINETVAFKAEDVPAIVGTLDSTEDTDTAAATGVLPIVGTLASAEADDTIAATGGVPILEGDVALTEADDAVVSTATLPLAAVASIAEDGDTVAGAGTLPIAGTASVSEEIDSIASAAVLPVVGVLSVAEEGDGLSSSGTLPVVGVAAIAEQGDTLEATGDLAAGGEGVLSVVEADDGVAASGVLSVAGLLAANENDDGLASTGALRIVGGLDYTEGGDTLVSAMQFYATANLTPGRIVSPSPIGRTASMPSRVTDPEVAMGSRIVRPPRRLP